MLNNLSTLGGFKYYDNNLVESMDDFGNVVNPKQYYTTLATIDLANKYGNTINNNLSSNIRLNSLFNEHIRNMNNSIKLQNDFQQKWGDVFAGAKLGLGLLGGLSTLGNMWLGFQNYKLAKQQLGIAKDQWAKTKEELARINRVRNKLTQSYVGE